MEVREVFAGFGLSEQLQHEVTEEIAKDKDKWVDFMMRYELGLEQPHPGRASRSALTIGISYIVGGIIPLSPYFFIADSQHALYYSCAITIVCLFVFGYFKSKVTGQPPFAGALKVLIIGALAAAAAFGMAKLINGR
jgi:predicted membrane protein (TIGR00267 family)